MHHLWPGPGLHLGDGRSQICSSENSKLVMASSATKFFWNVMMPEMEWIFKRIKLWKCELAALIMFDVSYVLDEVNELIGQEALIPYWQKHPRNEIFQSIAYEAVKWVCFCSLLECDIIISWQITLWLWFTSISFSVKTLTLTRT